MKILKKYVALILVLAITMTTLQVTVFAANPNEVQRINLGNGMEVSIVDSSDERIVVYYENDIQKQKAILYKESGEIYYYDLSLQNDLSRFFSDSDNISSKSYAEKYNIADFIVDMGVNDASVMDKDIVAKISRTSYTLLKSKLTAEPSGERFYRYLYGYKDEKQYEQNSWHFKAGIAFSVVVTAIGYIPGIPGKVAGVVGGALISAVTVQEWIKERFWVYKFNQTSPTVIEFVCRNQFTYEKQKRVEINGDTGYWETFYTEGASSIEYTRNNILEYPGLYW